MSRYLEEENKKQQEALSAALDRLNAEKTEQQEAEELDDLLETACWVRQSVEPPPQLLQETLELLEAQALLQEAPVPEKSGLSPQRKRSWLYAGALGLAASVLLALQLFPSSPSPVAVAPKETPQTTEVAVAPLRSAAVAVERKAEPVQQLILQAREEAAVMPAMPILAAAAAVAVEAGNESSGAVVAWSEQSEQASNRDKLYAMRTVRLPEERTEPLVLPGEAADVVWHDGQKTIWRHVYRQDTPQEVAVTQWRPERLQEKAALQRAAAVLGANRLVLSREGRVLVLEGRGGEEELRKVAAALVGPEAEK